MYINRNETKYNETNVYLPLSADLYLFNNEIHTFNALRKFRFKREIRRGGTAICFPNKYYFTRKTNTDQRKNIRPSVLRLVVEIIYKRRR